MEEKIIQEKINQLQSAIEKQNKQFRSSALRTAIIMLVLVIFVFGYTTIIYRKITELATPQTMAALLMEQTRAQLPAVRTMLTNQMQPCAETLAQRAVDSMEALVPRFGQYARNLISQTANDQLQKVEAKLMPKLEEVLDKAVQTALAEKNTSSISDAIAQQAGATASAEIKKVINEDFHQSVTDLQLRLFELKNKNAKQLTQREHSERMAIAAMLRLADLAKNEQEPAAAMSMAGIAEDVAAFLKTEVPVK